MNTKEIFLQYASKILPSDIVVNLEMEEMECEYGIIYSYNDQRSRQESSYSLAGNAPVLVTKSGEVIVLGTAFPVEWFLAEYKNGRWPRRAG